MDDVYSTRRLSTTSYNIILRQVHHKELPERASASLYHLGAFYPHGFGALIGYVSICPKKKVVQSIKADKLVAFLLLSDAKGWLGSSSFDLSPKLPTEDVVLISSMLSATSPPPRIGDNASSSSSIPQGSTKGSTTAEAEGLGWVKQHKLCIKMFIRYRPMLAGHDRETPHGIWVYPSFSFSSGEPVFLSAEKLVTPSEVTLRFDCETDSVSNSAMLNFDAHANFRNTSGVFCINQAGYTNMRLADLIDVTGTRVVKTFVVPNSRYKHAKGELFFVCTSVTIDGKVPTVRKFTPLSEYSSRLETRRALISAYVEQNHRFYEAHPSRFPSIANLSVFSYKGRVDEIPGSMFDVFRIPKTREDFYLNALRIAVQRMKPFERVTAEYVASFMKTAPMEDRIVAVMSMLCVYINWCEYITDETDNNTEDAPYRSDKVELMESFDCIVQRDAGDCEDFTRQMLTDAAGIKYNVDLFSSETMKDVRAVMDDFIFVSVLCGVSNASITSAKSTGKLNGHECGLAIPKYIFFKALSRTLIPKESAPQGQSVSASQRQSASTFGVSASQRHPLLSLYTEEEQNKGKGLSICVLEGTGNLYPCAKVQSKTNSMVTDLIFDNFPEKLTNFMKKEYFFSPHSPDNFYKVLLTLLTPEFFLEKGYRGFEFLVCTREASADTTSADTSSEASTGTRSAGATRGVPFLEFLEIDKNPNIFLAESPTIPLKVFHAASKIDYDNFPPMTLHPATQRRLDTDDPESMPPPRRDLDRDDVVNFQVSFDAVTPEFLTALYVKAASLGLSVRKHPEFVKFNALNNKSVGGYSFFLYR